MEQELEILKEELRQVRDFAKLPATTFPTFKMPIYFAKADLPFADLPNQPEQTQHALIHDRVPPASPTAVRTIPGLSNRDPTIPTMQQISRAHVATPYEPYVPPVYAAGAPTFTMPVMVNVPYKVDQYAEMEKEDASINASFRRGVIKCTPAPPNMNNNPLPNYENREVNMVTLDEEYGVLDCPDIDEADAITSSVQPVITVQLREPLTVQTYLPRVVVTTLIAKNPEYDTKWGRTKVTIHGEFSHPILFVNSIPVIDELDGATFHTLEIMQAIRVGEEAEIGNTKLSSAAKMVASEMLKYGYQPKNELGPKSSGIVEPIQLKHQRDTKGLEYEPASRRDRHGSSNTIFVPEQTLIPDQVGIDDIIEVIGNLFVAIAGEEEGINLNKLTIYDAEPGEILRNWTTSPSQFQLESW
ncbi:hypothetical protein H5410_056331 [Solanum commersonii]|uniref:G-patch domain-containing protein n=1 Tax=Solanum commersonii TaxID=4109 RepID=A0A9J5WLE7_SOLCO|nr:hypothetical protein H5410_056331 [Solanum commersonii]